jgi:alkylation response protein AidB-like acyl-CoA dehydrogenase
VSPRHSRRSIDAAAILTVLYVFHIMDFSFSQENQEIRRTVREFAEREIAPRVMQFDEKQEFPKSIFHSLAELGLLGILFPPEYEGAGLSYVDYVTILEELARVDGSIALSVAAHNSLCSNHIYQFGTEQQKQRYLKPLARGEFIGAWSLTEPTAGSDASDTKTQAKREGDGWVLNGSKTFATHGSACDVAVVFAVSSREAGKKGISAFIIEKGTEGFRAGKKENKLGMRASETSELIMDNCRVPDEALLGQEGQGFVNALHILDGGRISIAALAVGMAQGCLHHAVSYARQREQFDRPIAQFQAVQFMLADMATRTEAACWLTYRAASLKDQGRDVGRAAAMAKLYAGEVAVQAANVAVQIHGGYGFTKDYPVEKFYRDVKLCTIGEGTSEIQRLVIARSLIGRRSAQ